jgi:hypothetical protein
MRQTLVYLMAAAAASVAFIAMSGSASAQVVVVTGSPAIYGPQALSPVVCEVRREQFTDEHGWRVRDVLVCYPR